MTMILYNGTDNGNGKTHDKNGFIFISKFLYSLLKQYMNDLKKRGSKFHASGDILWVLNV